MKPYQQRVVEEKTELDIKRDKLTEFIKSDIYMGLPQKERERLQLQSKIMEEYSNVLSERIANFI